MNAKDTGELINADLVKQALNRLIEPGSVFEIRALEAKLKGCYRAGIVSGYFDSVQTVLKALSSIVSAKGIYITLNPVLPDLLARRCNRLDYVGKDATTADNGIIKRCRLLIDADPQRPAGISATDQEKRHASTTTRAIHDLLTARGWPEPLLADSGNGWHLVYSINLPVDDGGLVERVLKILAAQVDNEHCKVDQTCFNPSRIVKLYGTLACKGDSIPTRPHRMSKIVKAPDPVAVVSREQLEALANGLAMMPKTTAGATVSNAKHGRNGTFDVDGFLRDYNIAIKADHTKNGVRVIELPSCPFNADHGGHGEVAVFVQPGGKLGFKCHHASCKDKGWREFRGHFEPGCYDGKTPTSALDAKSVETGKPFVMLPHGPFPISDAGRALGKLLADTKLFHLRGGGIVKLVKDTDGFPYLHDVRPAALASDFESVARLMKMGKNKPEPATCSEQTAKLIAASITFRDAMPPIRVLTRCPVLIERDGGLVEISGYDRDSGIYAAGKPTEPMDIAEARRLLSEILEDFRFSTRADHARARAAIITPALIFGGLLHGRAPVDLGEADESQTGKGFRNKLTAAIYAQTVKTVTQQKGGVGSMEESFNSVLVRGANFISLDNVRGKLDSQKLESFLTEDNYQARTPFREDIEIDPRRVVFMMTSNKADLTIDFAKRTSGVLVLKQPEGYTFRCYPAGDILAHVEANQPRYLGAVHAVVKAWYAAGKPKTAETRHDFRPWAQVMDWITRNLLDAGPLLDGHRETQARMTNPVLNWLRDVALEVLRAKQAGAWLRAGDLLDLIAETAIETPGLPEHGDITNPDTRENAQRAMGRKLGLCFRAGNVITIDGMAIERGESYEPESRYTVREYCFSAAMENHAMPAHTVAPPEQPAAGIEKTAEFEPSGHRCGHAAAMDTAIKTQCPAIAAITPVQSEHSDKPKGNEGGNVVIMAPHGRMDAKPKPVTSQPNSHINDHITL